MRFSRKLHTRFPRLVRVRGECARRHGQGHALGEPPQKVAREKVKIAGVQASSEFARARAASLPRGFWCFSEFARCGGCERLRSLDSHARRCPTHGPHQVRALSAAARLGARCAFLPTSPSVQKRAFRPLPVCHHTSPPTTERSLPAVVTAGPTNKTRVRASLQACAEA